MKQENEKVRYSREQVKAMSQTEYEALICKELNEAGFRSKFHDEEFEYEPSEFVFGGFVVFDPQAVEYLKRIGLLDNGKCPMCSVREDELGYILQNSNSGAIYHVCELCYKRYARQKQSKRGKYGCFCIFIIVVFIIWGIIKLFLSKL